MLAPKMAEGSREKRVLACSDHGVLTEKKPSACPICGGEVLDLDDPTDRDFAAHLVRTRRMTRSGKAFGIAFAAGVVIWIALLFVPGLFEIVLVSGDLGMLLIILILYSILAARFNAKLLPGVRALERYVTTSERTLLWRKLTSMPPVVVAAIIVAFVVGLVLWGEPLSESWGFRPSDILRGERLWTLFSHTMVHGSIPHLLNNALWLIAFGIALDLRVGRALFLVIAFMAALGGGLTETFLTEHPERICVGISGAVYGLAGASLVLMPRRRFPIVIVAFVFVLPMFVFVPLLTGVMGVIDWAVRENIAVFAHLGGFLTGALVAFPLRWLPAPDLYLVDEERRAEKIEELQRSQH